MDPGTPQRFVRVDVSYPGRRSLVEQSGLHGGPSAREGIFQGARGERPLERLAPEAPRGEIPIEITGLEELPRAEAANVAVGDVRSVV